MLSTLDAVRRAGFEPHVAAPASGPLHEALAWQDVPWVPLSLHAPDGRRLPVRAIHQRLAALVNRESPRLVHANSLAMGRLSGPVCAERHVASLAHLRDIVGLSRAAIRDLNRHRKLIAVSDAVRRYHVAAGICDNRTVVVRSGVDLDRFRPRSANPGIRFKLGLPPNTALVGAAGQISLRKGTDTWLAAVRMLAATFPWVAFVWIGQRYSAKSEARALEQDLRVAADSDLRGRLFLPGFCRDMPQLLPELKVLMHAARQEPFGRVLMEGAACGIPMVATDVGGTREMFPPSVDAAALVPPNEPQLLAAAARRLLSEPGRRRQIAENARRHATSWLDARSSAARLVTHYQSLLA